MSDSNLLDTKLTNFTISRTILNDFQLAFNNLKPRVTTTGDQLIISQRGIDTNISLSLPKKTNGFTR